MPSSGTWRRVGPVRTDILDERIASNISVERIRELRTMSTATSKLIEAKSSSETSVLTGPTQRHISEDVIIYCYGRENFKSYITEFALRRSFL
jgi:hypothetical protein